MRSSEVMSSLSHEVLILFFNKLLVCLKIETDFFCDLVFKVDVNANCAVCLEGRGKCLVTLKDENFCG